MKLLKGYELYVLHTDVKHIASILTFLLLWKSVLILI
jgi:hypothetical protein